MSDVAIQVDHVWKKFKKGEIYDSLRDLIPAVTRRLFSGSQSGELQAKEFWAVKDVSFQVRDGEALGIIGPNGAGKSTILKLLSKILKPNKGRISVKGRVSSLIEIGAGFHPDLTGRENIYLNGTILGMTRDEINRKFDEIVEFSGIADFLDTPVKRYSSGMYARLAFSVAAHVDPEVLLVDEVLSVGDMSFQHRCLDKMRQKLRSGAAVVFVSHNLQAVASLCDRTVVMSKGSDVFDGPPGQALAVYLSAAQSSSARYDAATQSFRLLSAVLRTSDGREAAIVRPHAPFELVVTMECLADAPAFNVGIEFERTRDLFYCFGATTQELGHPLLQPKPGDVFTLRFHFIAHFARGHYRINLNLRDPRGAAFLHYAESVASFAVDEQVSYDGVVDVDLDVEIQQGVQPSLQRQLKDV
jgi:lipopolysaccharide transport system ATP-binding protein